MKSWILFGICSCLAAPSVAQVISLGSCPTVTVQENFDLSKYTGRWYENRRFFAAFQIFSDCVTAEYTPLADGSVKVNNTGIDRVTGSISTAIGNAKPMGDDPAKLEVKFGATAPGGNYWVLSTDYDTYSIVWSCIDYSVMNIQLLWILTRKPHGLTMEKKEELYGFLKKFNLKTEKFTETNQKNCGRDY